MLGCQHDFTDIIARRDEIEYRAGTFVKNGFDNPLGQGLADIVITPSGGPHLGPGFVAVEILRLKFLTCEIFLKCLEFSDFQAAHTVFFRGGVNRPFLDDTAVIYKSLQNTSAAVQFTGNRRRKLPAGTGIAVTCPVAFHDRRQGRHQTIGRVGKVVIGHPETETDQLR